MTTMNQINRDTIKEETIKDLEEVYRKASAMNLLPAEHGEVNKLIVRAFQAGADWALFVAPLEGYSNLTEAIEAGEPIDWERLDGKRVKCVHPELATLQGVLKRDSRFLPRVSLGWWDSVMDDAYISAFNDAWNDYGGWTLWLEGDIPMRRNTADQLKVGTYFLGSVDGATKSDMYVGETLESKVVLYTPCMGESDFPATEWVVLEEYGPFQKPEGK